MTLAADETQDLLGYFVANGELPDDSKPEQLEFTIGGLRSVWDVRRLTWDEWQDGRERATNQKTGEFDAYVAASWNVARVVMKPLLGPTVREMQQKASDAKNRGEKVDEPPANAAELLQRMFKSSSGVLLDLSVKVLKISSLMNDETSVKLLDEDVEAGKV